MSIVVRAELRIGDGVIWLKEQRGGYGFLTRVWARVTRIGFKRVEILCLDRRGGARPRWVSAGRLRVPEGADIADWPAALPVARLYVPAPSAAVLAATAGSSSVRDGGTP